MMAPNTACKCSAGAELVTASFIVCLEVMSFMTWVLGNITQVGTIKKAGQLEHVVVRRNVLEAHILLEQTAICQVETLGPPLREQVLCFFVASEPGDLVHIQHVPTYSSFRRQLSLVVFRFELGRNLMEGFRFLHSLRSGKGSVVAEAGCAESSVL